MSWHDDFDDDDEYGERRPNRAPVSKWRLVRRAAAYIGVVVGAIALVVGAVFAVNLVGTAANPAGFAAPDAYGPAVAMPPVTTLSGADDDGEQTEVADATGTETLEEPTGLSGSKLAPLSSVDPEWIASIADATGIPERALSAYALAHVMIAEEEAECGLDWATIAAIGAIESEHGSHGSSKLGDDGLTKPAIIGPALDGGENVAKIEDTDGGALDGDTTWDRAVGPMQFIPSAWEKWGADANGDGAADPHQIDDAALSTARYLCASGSMTSSEGWRAAVYSYNHDNDYVDQVATVALEFAESVG
ncbi:lytic transglycosylase domain-containing protein [Agromyces sp. CCNWLW203]|uniref:lytic transglycosylase domain-containing protein n=1 Tax=Agromyces sp. CCNWLW203 TaxID=3112842 RepID=UPI002F962457